MFAYLKGILTDISANSLTLEAGGIGYELTVSASCISDNPKVGQEAKIHTYMSVRDDGVSIYGFSSKIEKSMFLRLITVSGIGPKVAISILSNISLNDLSKAVAYSDAARLATVKGIGKKTAERIILELKDKISEEMGSVTGGEITPLKISGGGNDDAVAALVSLGYSKSEAVNAVAKYYTDGITTEQLIFKALKG